VSLQDNFARRPLLACGDVRDCDGITLTESPRATGPGDDHADVPDPRTIDPYQAVAEYPELTSLLAIAERSDTGWYFRHVRENGELVAIQGVRNGAGYLDIIRIYGPDRAVVARAWLIGERAGELLFNREGEPGTVIPELLSLGEPLLRPSRLHP
jgi:hypothetical protein